MAPVHRLAHAAAGLLTDPAAMATLHTCAGCCWMFLDRSRGAGRRWCSMADCGTEAKKRRYVEKRRARRSPRSTRASGSG
jgi:predicted RNA-binding Zn ribbon-like protein